jgi:hypothetical protein
VTLTEDLVMSPFERDDVREQIRSSTVTVDYVRGTAGLYRRTIGGGIYLLELMEGRGVPDSTPRTVDAATPVRYFTLGEAGTLLRRHGATIEALRGGKWVDDPGLFKYFCGAWGDQLEPLPITEDEARDAAAARSVELEAPASHEDLSSTDRHEPGERSRTDDLSQFVRDGPELISFPQPNVPERYKKRDA